MRLLLLLNGSRTRYAGGAGEARLRVWREYVSPGAQLEVGHLPDEAGLAYIPVRVSAREVSERVGVPVLDPGFLAVRTAEMLVEARAGVPVPA